MTANNTAREGIAVQLDQGEISMEQIIFAVVFPLTIGLVVLQTEVVIGLCGWVRRMRVGE